MIETSTEVAGAQTQFLPKPGAASFKRLLGRRSPPLSPTGLALCRRTGGTDHDAVLREKEKPRVDPRPAGVAAGAPRSRHGTNGFSPKAEPPRSPPTRDPLLDGGVPAAAEARRAIPRKNEFDVRVRPNGSRLSCGADPRRRHVHWDYQRARWCTNAIPPQTGRRQLQALVRLRHPCPPASSHRPDGGARTTPNSLTPQRPQRRVV